MLNYASEMARVYYALTNQPLSAIPTGHTPAYWAERCYRYQASLPDVISGGRNASFWLEQWYYFRTGQNYRHATGTLADWFWLAKLYDQVLRGANHNPNGQVGYNSAAFWANQLAGVPGLGGGGALQSLMSEFEADSPDGVFVLRNTSAEHYIGIASGTNHDVMLFQLSTSAAAFSAGNNAPEIINSYLGKLHGGVRSDDVAVTLSGAGWARVASTSYFGGGYNRTLVSGNYAEYTTLTGVTRLGIWVVPVGTIGAIAKVTIDGDATLANSLPTAQQLVDAGQLAATALVANGGTLNPTDRCYNVKDAINSSASPFERNYIEFASGLTAGTHVVRMTHTGYRPVGGTGDWIPFAGIWFDDPAASIQNYAGATPPSILPQATNHLVNIADWDFAFNFRLDGGLSFEWMGHTNSLKTVIAGITVDDVPVLITGTTGTVTYLAIGTNAVLNVAGVFRHSESVPDVGSYQLQLTFNAGAGISATYEITWLAAGTATGYMPQMTLRNSFDRGSLLAGTEDYTLTANDGTEYGHIVSEAGYCWQQAGNWAALCVITGYGTAPNVDMFIQDRADGGVVNKIYAQRINSGAVAINDVWTTQAVYRIKNFPNGAEAALAR